jgi:hypothetical protein
MSIYGECAIRATKKLTANTCKNPMDAWNLAISELTDSRSVRDKSCPRNAFLGLCEAGLIRGVERGRSTKTTKNKEYALNALQVLRQNPRPFKPLELWQNIGNRIAHNGQMDVVLALWGRDLLL